MRKPLNPIFNVGIRWMLAFLLSLLSFAALPMHAQTFNVLHTFTGPDGANPEAGLTMDRAGNLYGTAATGGQGFQYCNLGCGVVFKLTHTASGWIYSRIYAFSGADGANPSARVVFGPDGAEALSVEVRCFSFGRLPLSAAPFSARGG